VPSANRPLADLLAAVSAHSPAPGGGSAAAWAGAIAAALLEMSCAFADDDAMADRASTLQAELLESAERELHSYLPVLEAVRLAADDPAREPRLADALSRASDAPLMIVRAAAEVAEGAAAIAVRSKPALKGDAVAGVLLAEAACQAAARLVQINLAGHEEDPRLAEIGGLLRRAADARRSVMDANHPAL